MHASLGVIVGIVFPCVEIEVVQYQLLDPTFSKETLANQGVRFVAIMLVKISRYDCVDGVSDADFKVLMGSDKTTLLPE